MRSPSQFLLLSARHVKDVELSTSLHFLLGGSAIQRSSETEKLDSPLPQTAGVLLTSLDAFVPPVYLAENFM